MSGPPEGWIHLLALGGLAAVFVVGTWRAINLGALALVLAFFVGTLIMGQDLAQVLRGFPVDLLVLLAGVTYLFGVASQNGSIEKVVNSAARALDGRRALLPWMVFAIAAVPTTAGALGSAGVAIIAPIALRLAGRCGLDRRMMALMVLHGAACGNFSPLNALGVIVLQGAGQMHVPLSASALFAANIGYNLLLGVLIQAWFRGARACAEAPVPPNYPEDGAPTRAVHVCTLAAIVAVATVSLVFSLNIGFLALAAAVALQIAFPRQSAAAERRIAWDVILLVCGIVTYVAVLQRYGTVGLIGTGIAALHSPSLAALLICAAAAITSAFASSAGILGAMMLLAAPFVAAGSTPAAGLLIALAISATVVDSSPFSTAGALVVANAREDEQSRVYGALLKWAACMVLTAPLATWAVFVLAG
jgi:di/tricarboxylate transporter